MSEEQEINNTSGLNKPDPLFSVIIPTFNRADLLPRSVRSVVEQTFSDFELIIVDDGSTDNTLEVVKTIKDPRLRYVRQESQGVSAARNLGVASSRGRYITFLDSDDEALPPWLAHFAAGFKQPQTGIVCVGYFKVVEQDGLLHKTEVLPSNLGPMFDNQRVRVHAGTFALCRTLFEAVGGYAEGLAFGENTEVMIRSVSRCRQNGGQVISIAKPLVTYYKQPFDRSKAHTNYKTRLESVEYVLARHADRFRKDPRAYAFYLATAGTNAAKLENYDQARFYFRAAVQVNHWDWRHYGRLLLAMIPALGRRVWMRY